MPSEVILLALDGIPPSTLFEPSISARMPNLAALRAKGSSAPLESTIPAITVPAWASAMTSRDPGTLGVYGFRNRPDHTYAPLRVATSASITAPAVWDHLGELGRRSIVVGLPPGYPPRRIVGEWVGCFLTPDPSSEYTWPSALRDEIATVTKGGYVFDVEGFRSTPRAELLARLRDMLRVRWSLARHLLATRDVALFVLHEIGTDRLHHGFWKDHDTAHPKHDPASPFRSAVPDYYALLDEQIGELLAVAPDAAVVIASDHGCQAMHGGVLLNQWLVDQGYLALRSTPPAAAPLTHDLIDWRNTRAWGAGGYYGRVWLNVRGREPEGQVEPGEVDRLCDELRVGLSAIADANGAAMATRVLRPRDIYREVRGVAPDLMVYFDDLRWRAVASVGANGWHTFENDTGPDDANHSEDGIVVLGTRSDLVGARLVDLGPTVLDLLGEPTPEGAQGRSLLR